jgi:hypothetical protein
VSAKAIARQQDLVALLDRVAMHDARVVEATQKCFGATRAELAAMEKMEAFELEVQLQARGWTREEFEVAVEARRPRSETSYAIQMAHERVTARIRQTADRGSTTVNVAVVIPAANQVSDEEIDSAPIIDVDP